MYQDWLKRPHVITVLVELTVSRKDADGEILWVVLVFGNY